MKTVPTDGPLINGHPILGINEVQQWFSDAGYEANTESAKSLAQAINHAELFGYLWKNTSALRTQRGNDQFRLQCGRVTQALEVLRMDLPLIIEAVLKVDPNVQSDNFNQLKTLLNYANTTAPSFQQFSPRGRGRQPELWHNVARNLAKNIKAILEASSSRRFGYARATSPVVRILQMALIYLNIHKSPETIVEALRPKRTRKRKKLAMGK